MTEVEAFAEHFEGVAGLLRTAEEERLLSAASEEMRLLKEVEAYSEHFENVARLLRTAEAAA